MKELPDHELNDKDLDYVKRIRRFMDRGILKKEIGETLIRNIKREYMLVY